jgi:hypothetical protein
LNMGMNVKHWTPAKKHLEYLPEPTSLRARNRPEIEMRASRCLENPELCSLRFVAQARTSESRIGRQTGSPDTDREI